MLKHSATVLSESFANEWDNFGDFLGLVNQAVGAKEADGLATVLQGIELG